MWIVELWEGCFKIIGSLFRMLRNKGITVEMHTFSTSLCGTALTDMRSNLVLPVNCMVLREVSCYGLRFMSSFKKEAQLPLTHKTVDKYDQEGSLK